MIMVCTRCNLYNYYFFPVRWDLIAGRVPGRQPEEIERYWIMRNSEGFAEKRRQLHTSSSHKTTKANNRPRFSIYPPQF